jgi:hypothetical protein
MKADILIGKEWSIDTSKDYKKWPWSFIKKHRMKWLKKNLPKITKKQMAMERELADWFQIENYEERHR